MRGVIFLLGSGAEEKQHTTIPGSADAYILAQNTQFERIFV